MRNAVADIRKRKASDLNQRKAKIAQMLAAEDKMYEQECQVSVLLPNPRLQSLLMPVTMKRMTSAPRKWSREMNTYILLIRHFFYNSCRCALGRSWCRQWISSALESRCKTHHTQNGRSHSPAEPVLWRFRTFRQSTFLSQLTDIDEYIGQIIIYSGKKWIISKLYYSSAMEAIISLYSLEYCPIIK